MRTHIAKSLQTRSKAIRNAVKQYNTVAVSINRPTLDWSKVTHYSFLDEFNLLRDTRHAIDERPWADPVIRETMRKYQRLQRAQEEITRCNIEIRRLHTSIVDEHQGFDTVLENFADSRDPLAGEIREFIALRKAVNTLLIARITQTYVLPGFTGIRSPGVRKGQSDTCAQPASDADPLIDVSDDDAEDELDDDFMGNVGGLVDFISNMSLD